MVLVAAVVTMAILTTSLLAVYGLFTVDVPSFEGLSAFEARVLASAADLELLEVETTAGQGDGRVANQAPRPHRRAFVSSTVVVSVSRARSSAEASEPEERAGPPPGTEGATPSRAVAPPAEAPRGVRVPKVIGKTEAQAKLALERVGLALGEVRPGVSEDYRFGVIFSQRPKPGELAPAGTSITVSVNQEDDEPEPDLEELE